MNSLLKIRVRNSETGSWDLVDFGIPTEEKELEKMFKLRYEVYVEEKKYIPLNEADTINKIEKDLHDLKNECIYFVAQINNCIIGTARIIKSTPLPAEKDYFTFSKPKVIENLEPIQRAEIGRIISRPQKVSKKLPRNIVMLGLFYSMVDYGIRNNLLGGYGAIKKRAYYKFKKLGIPLHEISNSQVIYDKKSKDPLKNFFSEDDPVIMTYFLTKKVKEYFDKIFKSKILFEKRDEEFVFKGDKLNIIDKILLKLSLIF